MTYEGVNAAGKWQAYVLNMTSQQWLDETEVDRPIWWHWLIIIVPEKISHKDFATVIGTGNSNNEKTPPPIDEEYFRASQYVATHTGTVVAVLYQIPNEPLTFAQDPLHKSRSEDAIIAFGWRMFSTYNESDDYRYNWITHFPMAKAQVLTADTIQEFAWEYLDTNITRFAVAGASKRGWATWLAAAADERFVAFVPMVMDMLHFHKNLHHMWKAYGGWTWAFGDYYAENITMDLDANWTQQLFAACDPVNFLDRFAGREKMVIDATADEFFMPDDEVYWWDEFPEPKHFEMVPDAEHSLSTGVEDLVPSMSSFITAFLNGIPRPVFSWSIENETGIITAEYWGNVSAIHQMSLWHGRSCGEKRRDFRILNLDDPCYCGVTVSNGDMCAALEAFWFREDISPNFTNDSYAKFIAHPPEMPENHWTAFLIGLEVQLFETDHPYMILNENEDIKNDKLKENYIDQYGRLVFSTQVSIVPQTFPFPDCHDSGCYGTLV